MVSVMLIPIKMVWGMQMRTSRKITLAAVGGLVIITMIVSIVRTVIMANVTSIHDAPSQHIFYLFEVMIGKYLRETEKREPYPGPED
jgi:hypothetical protein